MISVISLSACLGCSLVVFPSYHTCMYRQNHEHLNFWPWKNSVWYANCYKEGPKPPHNLSRHQNQIIPAGLRCSQQWDCFHSYGWCAASGLTRVWTIAWLFMKAIWIYAVQVEQSDLRQKLGFQSFKLKVPIFGWNLSYDDLIRIHIVKHYFYILKFYFKCKDTLVYFGSRTNIF